MFAQRAPRAGLISSPGGTGGVGKAESDVLGQGRPWPSLGWGGPHCAFHLCLFLGVYASRLGDAELVPCPAGRRVDFLSGTPLGVGGVISSEGHCMVGQVHRCSEVRPVGWWGPKRNWITQGPGWGWDGGT